VSSGGSRHAGTVVLVTGAARGIGRAVAVTFASEGANVVICDLGEPVREAQTATAKPSDLEGTAALVRALGAECIVRTADVRDQGSLDLAVVAALEGFGHIDTVVANAGIMHSGAFWQIDEPTWQAVLDIDLSGVWRTAKAVAPHLIARRHGSIVVTASVQSQVARKGLAAYTAAKHGLLGLVKTMALELGDHDVRVNAVLPGAVHTPMIDNPEAGKLTSAPEGGARLQYFQGMAALREEVILPAEAVASAISWLASPEARYVTGIQLPVDAGSLVLPGFNHSAGRWRGPEPVS
jgi:SDR family mycofactocin-dependent oxidoreductase